MTQFSTRPRMETRLFSQEPSFDIKTNIEEQTQIESYYDSQIDKYVDEQANSSLEYEKQ